MKRLIRFFEIDLQYFKVKLPTSFKISNILKTNFSILINLVLIYIFRKKNKFTPVLYNSSIIFYDTPFSTKTFLSATYDFYIETCKLKIFSKKPVIVDVGANIGQFLFAVKTFFPLAEVYSFEPDKQVYSILKKNAQSLRNVYLYNLALGNFRGKTNFYVSREFSEWSTLVLGDLSLYKTTKVAIDRGDSVLKQIGAVDLLKIDVEGAELHVLKGMEKTLKKANYLLVEVSILRNVRDFGSSKLINFLSSRGFHIYNIGRIFSSGVGEDQQAIDILFKHNFRGSRR